MFLNIITPCSRPQNLYKISDSINIPIENYRWIVVFDFDSLPDNILIPNNCETYLHRDPKSIVGHAQRNFALNLITHGHVYSNDDDTILHKELWENIKDLDDDFITFFQEKKSGELRLTGDVCVDKIDSHNFIVKHEIIGDTKFIIDKYNADGHFAVECYNKANTKNKIEKILSTYNFLR